MTTGADINQPQPRKGRRKSAAQQAQWQFQANLLDQMSEAVIAVGQDERITYLNRAAVAQYRVDPVSAIGQPLSHVYRYEWLQPEDELAANVALAAQGHWRGENRHIRPDGSALQVESLVTVLRDAAGNATGLLATIRDITDRKQMERDLRVSELRYRRLADTLPQLVWTANATGVVDYYNIHIHDFDPAVWQGASGFDWASLLHPEDLAPTLAAWQQAVQQRRPYSCEHRLQMADGSWRWHLSRALLMQDADNGLRWYGTATDIHERKVAEEALRANQERLQLGVQVAGLALAKVDYTSNLIHLDATAATLFGLPADVGAVPRAIVHACFHPDDAPEIFQRINASFDPTGPGWFAMTHRVVHPDGAVRWLSVRKQVFFADDADGARRPVRALLAAFDITEQKVAEAALRASEERYRTLFETMDEGFCVFEMLYDETGEPVDYRFLEANPAFAHFTGLENAIGKTAYELVPNLEPHWVAIYGEVARTGEARHFTEGSAAMGRWFEVYAFRFGGPESRRVALLFNNITERKQTEDALRDNEARLQAILHNIPASIYMLTTDQRYLYVNRYYEQLANITNAEIQGKSIYDIFDPETAVALAANDQRALSAKAPLILEEFAPQDGAIHTYASIKTPLLDAAGEPYALIGISTDITERKEIEERLRASEERLRLATEAGGVGIFDYDAITNRAEISPIYAQITGLPPAVAIERERWLALVHPEDRSLVEAIWREALSTGASYYYECRLIRPDGVLIWVEVNAWVTTDDAGRSKRITGAVRDVTQQKQAALHQQFLLDLNSSLSALSDGAAIRQMVVERLGQYLGVDRCRFNAIDLATDSAILLAAWSQPGLLPPRAITPLSLDSSAAYLADAGAGRTLVVQDASQEQDVTVQTLLTRGFSAAIGVPCLREGKWVASLYVLQRAPRQWRADEVQLVESVVHHCWPLVEKAQIEAELRRQEGFLRQIADNVPGLIGYVDAEERYRFVNATFEAWFQRPREQILGHTVAELIGEAEHRRLDEHRQQALAGTPASYETHFNYPDGGTRTVWARYRPDSAADGRILGFYLFLMDITERKVVEEELYASEARFRAVQQASPDGYMIFESVRDEQGAIIDFRWRYVNPASEQMVGRTQADLLGKRLLEEMPGNRAEGLFDAYVRVVETGEVYQREFCYQHEGIDRWFRNTAAQVGDGFAVTFSDITARKQAEADQQLFAGLAEQIRLAEDPEELIAAAVRLVGEHLRVGRCLWIEIYAAEQRGFIHAQHCRGLPPVPETYANADYSSTTRTELTAGRVVVNQDAQQDPRTAAFYETVYAPYDERAYIGIPLLHEGRWRGIFSVTQATPRQWQAREIHLLETVAERVWLAVEKLRLNTILRANEARLRQALTAANAGGWFYDLAEETAHWSPEMFALYGLSPALGAPTMTAFAALIHPADRAQSPVDLAAARHDGGHFAVEFRIVRADGQERWINRSGVVDRDAAGQPLAASGIDQDITVRKQAEIALQQSNAILQGVLEGSSDAIFVRDLTGRYLLVNEAGAAQVRLPKSAIIGQRYQDLFTAADVAAIAEDDRPVFEQGRTVTLEQVIEQRGVPRYWHTLKMPLRNATGDIVGLISSARDLTERKAAEEALRLSEARYRTIFEHVGVSLWEEDFSRVKQAVDTLVAQWRTVGVTDLAAIMRDHCATHPDFVQAMLDRVRILDVNEETVRLYGHAKAELLRPFAQHFDAETRVRFVDQLVLLATGGQRYHFDGPITTPAGETRHIAFTVVFPAEPNGDFTRVLLSGLDVTPLKAAEVENRRLFLETQSLLAQVQEGERFLQSIADTTPNVIYLFDLGTMRNRYANREVAVTLGYTTAEVETLGDRLIPTLLHPDDQAYMADHLAHLRAVADGEVAEWEYRMRHKAGDWRWLNSREIVFERDEQGVPTVVLGTLQDITARKEAEVALRASEARFRHLAEAMPQLVWVSAADGATTYINSQWLAYSGMTLAATLAEGMWPAIHPEDQPLNRAQWRHALESGEAYEGEVRLRRQDGVYRWFLERATPVRDEVGVIQQWFGVSMDIHDRKAAEQRQAELVALLEAMLDNAPIGFAFLDREQRFVRINQMLADQHGRPITDHIGRTLAEIDPHTAKGVGPILQQIFATGVGIYNQEISGPQVTNPNAIGHALVSWFPVAVNGVIEYMGTMNVDITERKRQERHQQFLSDLGLDLRLLSDSETILSQLVGRLGEYLQVAGCRINEVDQSRAQFTLQKDWVAADAPWPAVTTPGVYPLTELASPALLAALQAGQTVVVVNTLHDPRTAPVADNYEHDQVHSLIGVPIFRQGEWRATLSLKGHGERQWRPDEVTLVEAVAGQLSALLEKVRAEEALRASEERLRLALVGGGMGIWESQVVTNRSLWSPEEYALFGLPMGVEITNELFSRLVHPDDLPGLQAAMERLFSSGNDHIGEFRVIRPDGAVRWLADRVTVLRNEAGQLVRLLGINFDITERKEREAMIRQQLAEIEAIYATAPIGLCLVDRDLRYVRINETLATINGSTIAGQLGLTLAETLPPAGYLMVEPLYHRVITTGIPLLDQEIHESYIDPAQARDWLASYYPLKNAEGVVTGVNAVILEITERKRQERQLKELNATLEERVQERTKALEQANRALSISNRELEQFTYAAAHDLRTPLRGIANLVQWISEDAAPVLSPDSQRHLAKLGGRVKRLEKMLEDLLAYSRVGRVRYLPEMVDMQQLVQSLSDLLAPPVGYGVNVATPLPTFDTLRIPLEMVFRNLLSNAIHHHHDPARGQVVITVRDLGAWYEFCISDNGPGIDPQFHDRIFGMFQTLKPRDEVEGSGIGLALVKKTVESVGGRIWVESALGQGTSFYFTWPKE